MGKNYKVKIIRNEFRNGKIIEILLSGSVPVMEQVIPDW